MGLGPKPRKSGAPKGGAPKGGAPMGLGPKPGKVGPRKGGAPKGWGPEGGGPKISRFFFPFPPPFRCFCVSLGVFSWNFGGVLKRRCPEMCTFGVLWLSCASPGGPVWWGRRGFTRQPESPNVHISGFRRSKHHQNSTRRHPERHRKSKTVAGKGRKRAKFWAVRRRGVQWRGGGGSCDNHTTKNNNAKPRTIGAPEGRPALPSKV